jgi:predicted enzyme related to lactoylglutathione lyase
MEDYVAYFSLYVRDYDRAASFYCDVLGFEKTDDEQMGPDSRWLTVTPPGAQTGITLLKDSEHAGTGSFVLSVKDIDCAYSTAVDLGAASTEAPAPQPYGIQAVIEDPDGNSVVLVQVRQQVLT